MSGENRQLHRARDSDHGGSAAKRIFGRAVAAGAGAYVRSRDLPRLLPLWPEELEDRTVEGTSRVLAKLRRALRAERRRARAGHWSYDLNRHLGLLSAYRGELASLCLDRPRLSRTARAAPERQAASERGHNDDA